MKNKHFAVGLLAGAMITALLTGCGSPNTASSDPAKSAEASKAQETTETQAPVEPLDLTGLWVQEDAEATYMAADIKDDTIGVFFVLEGDDTPWTYWVGTYAAPTDDKDAYEWTSESTYGGNGMLASGADTKDFTYKNGKLQCEVSIQGTTNVVTFVRGEWDTSNIPDSAYSSVNTDTTEVLPLEIKDSGWVTSNGYLYYYATLYNPNTEIAVECPSFRITARDGSNVILGTQDQVCSIIYPQQELTYGSQAFAVDEEPATVDFESLAADDYNLKNASVLDTYLPLKAVNVAIRSDKVVGEINNPNDYGFDMAAVTAILKDDYGNLVGVKSTFVDNVAANSTAPFEISTYGCDGAASCDVYACQW